MNNNMKFKKILDELYYIGLTSNFILIPISIIYLFMSIYLNNIFCFFMYNIHILLAFYTVKEFIKERRLRKNAEEFEYRVLNDPDYKHEIYIN
jgi:predicted membrane protein